jgi:hypothetical protein
MTHDELCRDLIAERWQPVPQRTRKAIPAHVCEVSAA